MSPAKKKSQKMLKITQFKSQIGYSGKQRKVLAGLGLGRIGRSVTRIDDDCTRGMVTKVTHMVTVEEVEA
jgi:large subunit ribosomal protein L30